MAKGQLFAHGPLTEPLGKEKAHAHEANGIKRYLNVLNGRYEPS